MGNVEPYETRFCYLWIKNTTSPTVLDIGWTAAI